MTKFQVSASYFGLPHRDPPPATCHPIHTTHALPARRSPRFRSSFIVHPFLVARHPSRSSDASVLRRRWRDERDDRHRNATDVRRICPSRPVLSKCSACPCRSPVRLVGRSGGGLRARASDQGFLPIDTRKYIMLLDWTGREIRENSAGQSRTTWLRSSTGWGVIDSIGSTRCANSAACSSKRPSRQFAGACRAGLLATVFSGKDGRSSRFSLAQRVDAARRPI